MQLDHIFHFVQDLEAAETLGRSLGLAETYRRNHVGQGTANICYCFENAFLELLLLTDRSEAEISGDREGRPCAAGILERAWNLSDRDRMAA